MGFWDFWKPKQAIPQEEEKPQANVLISEATLSSQHYRSVDGATYKQIKKPFITFEQRRDMFNDPVVQFGFGMLTLPIRQVKINIVGDVEIQKQFIQKALIDSGILSKFLEYMSYGVGFGFAPLELRWQYTEDENGYYLLPRQPKLLRWEDTLILEETEKGKDLGAFIGFNYKNTGGSNEFVDLLVKDNKACLFTWNEALTDKYGFPQLDPAWESYRARYYMLFNDYPIYLEKRASGHFKGRYPNGSSPSKDGLVMDNGERLAKISKYMRQGADALLPSDRDEKGNYLWDFEEMAVSDRSAVYSEANRVFKSEILSALLVPERAVSEGQYGTKAEAETHGEVLNMVQNAMMEDIIDCLNDFVVSPLLKYNFITPSSSVNLAFKDISVRKREAINLALSAVLENWKAGKPVDKDTQEFILNETGLVVPVDSIEKEKTSSIPSIPGNDTSTEEGESVEETAEGLEGDIDNELEELSIHKYIHNETPYDSRLIFQASKKTPLKLSRKPTEVELMFYSEKQWIELLSSQIESESELINTIEEVVLDQKAGAEAFIRRVWTDTQNSPSKRIAEITSFELRNTTKEKRAIKNFLTDQTLEGAKESFRLANASSIFPNSLTGETASWVAAQTELLSKKVVNDVTQRLTTVLIEAAGREANVNEAVRVSNDVFDSILNAGNSYSIPFILSGLASVATNQGRQMILERIGTTGAFKYNGGASDNVLGGDDEIVVVKRVELMDQNTCEVCRRVDGLTIRADDERLKQWIAPRWCLGNWPSKGTRCRGLNLYLKKSMRESFREVTMPPAPDVPIPPSLQTGAF